MSRGYKVTRMALLATLLLSSPCLGFTSDAPGSESLQIDHLIVGAADLDSGMGQFEQLTGVRPVIGGDHPGRGSRNALVSLGNGRYPELLAARGDASPSADIDALRKLKDLTPLGWAVSTGQPEVTVRHLRQRGYGIADPLPGSRVKPDGTTLMWVSFRITKPEKVEGTVVVELLIGEEGEVAHLEIRRSIPEFDAAAIACVRQWQFEPLRANGVPHATIAQAPVTFRIYWFEAGPMAPDNALRLTAHCHAHGRSWRAG